MIRRFIRNRDAVVAVEFAILAIPMLMLIGLVIFAGLGFYSQVSLTFGTQQAAIASVAGKGANPTTVFSSNIPKTLTGATVACAAATGSTTCTGTGSLSVPFAGLFNGSSTMTLTATATAAQPGQ